MIPISSCFFFSFSRKNLICDFSAWLHRSWCLAIQCCQQSAELIFSIYSIFFRSASIRLSCVLLHAIFLVWPVIPINSIYERIHPIKNVIILFWWNKQFEVEKRQNIMENQCFISALLNIKCLFLNRGYVVTSLLLSLTVL